jgi:hypothetical protein
MRNPYPARVIGAPSGRKPRNGLRLFMLLLLAVILIFVLQALFFPWIYFTGGHWHALPQWQGGGRFKADGGEYALFIRMMPAPSGSHVNLSTSLRGNALLCTPEGQRLSLRLYAGMAKHLPLDVRGQPVTLVVSQRSVWAPWLGERYGKGGSPTLQLKGTWGDRAIDATGFFRRKWEPVRGVADKPVDQIPITIKFEENSQWVFWPDCPR